MPDKCEEVFRLFDDDNDGYLSEEEFATAIRAVGCTPSFADINIWLSSLQDRKRIDLESFKSIGMKNMKTDEQIEEELLNAFKQFDKNKTGEIKAQELRHYLVSVGDKLSSKEADELINQADPTNCGVIKYEEFVPKYVKDMKAI